MNLNNQNINDIIIRHLSGESTTDEDLLLKNWLAENIENNQLFIQVKQIFENKGEDEINKTQIDQKEWERLETRIDSTLSSPLRITKRKTIKRPILLLRVAAALLVILAGYWFFTFYSKSDIVINSKNICNQKIILPDESSVFMNINTEIIYPKKFSKNNREISLKKGEAFFEITPDKNKPFIIHTGIFDVKVVGTSFNIKIDSVSNTISVTVKTGIVQVYPGNKNNIELTEKNNLYAGQCVIYNVKTNCLKIFQNTDNNYLSWKTNILIFDKTPLDSVIKTLENNYHIQFILDQPELSDLKLSARFSTNNIDEVIEMLKGTFNISIQKKDNQFRISKIKN